MRWSDVALAAPPTAAVRRGRVALSSGAVEGEPKPTRSRRTVPLPAFAVTALRKTRAAQAAEQLRAGPAYVDTGYVATDQLGAPLRPEVYSGTFARVVDAAGLRHIRLHDARHSAASLLLSQGVAIVVVAAILGHDPAVTASTYAHAFADDKAAAMAALDRLIGG